MCEKIVWPVRLTVQLLQQKGDVGKTKPLHNQSNEGQVTKSACVLKRWQFLIFSSAKANILASDVTTFLGRW